MRCDLRLLCWCVSLLAAIDAFKMTGSVRRFHQQTSAGLNDAITEHAQRKSMVVVGELLIASHHNEHTHYKSLAFVLFKGKSQSFCFHSSGFLTKEDFAIILRRKRSLFRLDDDATVLAAAVCFVPEHRNE